MIEHTIRAAKELMETTKAKAEPEPEVGELHLSGKRNEGALREEFRKNLEAVLDAKDSELAGAAVIQGIDPNVFAAELSRFMPVLLQRREQTARLDALRQESANAAVELRQAQDYPRFQKLIDSVSRTLFGKTSSRAIRVASAAKRERTLNAELKEREEYRLSKEDEWAAAYEAVRNPLKRAAALERATRERRIRGTEIERAHTIFGGDDEADREVETQKRLLTEIGKTLETLIKGGNDDAQVVRLLGLKYVWDISNGDSVNEHVMKIVQRCNSSGEFTPVLMAVAERWTKRPMDIHALCHNFEDYGRGLPGGSVLDYPANHEAATLLFSAAANRQAGNGNFTRIIEPVALYNSVHVDPGSLDGPFPFKPGGIDYGAVLQTARFDPKYHQAAIDLCSARTPREFIELLVSHGESLGGSVKRQAALLAAVRGRVGEAATDAYMKKHFSQDGKSLTLDALCAYVHAKPSEVIDALCVDVEGTLIIRRHEKDGSTREVLNDQVLLQIDRFRAAGREVLIFSGGDIGELSKKLAALGLDPALLPVRAKDDYRGKTIHWLIDDTPCHFQGLSVVHAATQVYHSGLFFFEPEIQRELNKQDTALGLSKEV